MAAPTKAMLAGLLALWLAACPSPPTNTTTPEAPTPAKAADVPSPPASQTASVSPPLSNSAQIDASQLPEDVRDFILKQRMCRHFSRPAAEGGNPAMASVTCANAGEAAWKALVRKYQDNDAIASVLLAERPPTEAGE